MSLRDDLIAARALIDTPEKWAKGNDISPENGRYCAAVACNQFASAQVMFQALRAAFTASHAPARHILGVCEIFEFNDDPATTHADIMALFDRAIAAAEETTEC